MLKILFNILLVVGLLYLIRAMFSSDAGKPVPARVKSKPTPPRDTDAELLVEDPQCGVFVPYTTSVKGPGDTRFCSEECKKAWEAAHG